MNQIEPTEQTIAEVIKLETQLKAGASWFFWIAGLSIVNSIIYLFDGSTNFIVGLGFTQFVDGFVTAISSEFAPNSGGIVQGVGLLIVLGIAGIFALFGFFGRKKHQWAFIIGMVLYAIDGLLFLVFSDYLSFGFHVFAMFGLWAGLKSLRQLVAIEKDGFVIQSSPTPPQKQPRGKKFWRNIALAVGILLIPLVLFLVTFIFAYYTS